MTEEIYEMGQNDHDHLMEIEEDYLKDYCDSLVNIFPNLQKAIQEEGGFYEEVIPYPVELVEITDFTGDWWKSETYARLWAFDKEGSLWWYTINSWYDPGSYMEPPSGDTELNWGKE